MKNRLIPNLISSFFPMRFSPPPSSYNINKSFETANQSNAF